VIDDTVELALLRPSRVIFNPRETMPKCISRKYQTLFTSDDMKKKEQQISLNHSIVAFLFTIELIATLQQAKLTQQRHSFFLLCMNKRTSFKYRI
jgi:hypothetical protein